MSHPFLPQEQQASIPPFTLLSEHFDPLPNGYFRPATSITFDASIRTSGFLTTISADELRLLIGALSFVTPNGQCHPLLTQLTETLKISRGKAETLLKLRWNGVPLWNETDFGGQPAFFPTLALVGFRGAAHSLENTHDPPQNPSARNEAVISHSRAAYGRPRVEVEQQIARLNGWSEPPFQVDPKYPRNPPFMEDQTSNNQVLDQANEEAIVRDQLLKVGWDEAQADSLLERFDLLRIRRQLSWLNYHRGVRNRAGFLMAAVADDYEAPLALRLSKSQSEAKTPDEVPPLDTHQLP